jgi:mediator of RNA polymerase II transcription subunit 14
VRKPAKLKGLDGKIDRDVSYVASTGKFRVRLRHAVGEPTLPTFRSRVKAIDRFVNFLEALEDSKDTISSESATLNEVSCFYSTVSPPAPAADGDNGEESSPTRWKIVMDLSGVDIRVRLEKGNPHLRGYAAVVRERSRHPRAAHRQRERSQPPNWRINASAAVLWRSSW